MGGRNSKLQECLVEKRELQTQLQELQTRQEQLTRQIAAIDAVAQQARRLRRALGNPGGAAQQVVEECNLLQQSVETAARELPSRECLRWIDALIRELADWEQLVEQE